MRAFNLAGYSAYSDPWSFEVVDPAEAPILQSPVDTAVITNPVVLNWQAGAGGLPDGYELELDGKPRHLKGYYSGNAPRTPSTAETISFTRASSSNR